MSSRLTATCIPDGQDASFLVFFAGTIQHPMQGQHLLNAYAFTHATLQQKQSTSLCIVMHVAAVVEAAGSLRHNGAADTVVKDQ